MVPSKYKFKFSTEREISGRPSCCRVITITLLVVLSILLPLLSLLKYFGVGVDSFTIPIYAWVIYVIIFNTVVLILLGLTLTSSIAYPYSNRFFTKHLKRTTNQRFGMEFSRCVERMTRMIKETTERQSDDRASEILSGKDELNSNAEFLDSENSINTLNPRDIYMRVASNLELIELYTAVN